MPRREKGGNIGDSDFHQIKKYCLNCEELLKLRNTRDIKRKKFCSHSCQGKYNTRNGITSPPPKPTQESRKKAGETISRKMALGLIPKPPKSTPESSRKAGLKIRGKNHWNWIPDRSKIKKKERPSEAETWGRDILYRDDFTCQICHEVGNNLNAHHIKSWKDYPDDRYDLDNGITLCFECHKWVHRLNPLNFQ